MVTDISKNVVMVLLALVIVVASFGTYVFLTSFDAVPAAGSGTVREAVVFGIWSFLNGEVALTRDIISPGVSFSPGQNITANYTWQL